ncbi:MAG: glycosyltransferase family 4 protein [Verrucomicrobia bacterium]|nr:glycosyltransferase family 4 protein [Verrucomicrobiota bacterium]
MSTEETLLAENIRIAVDLTPMLPGGRNGGVKFAIIELLKSLKERWPTKLKFLFLTADDTHNEVVSLLGEKDLATCVLHRSKSRSVPALLIYGKTLIWLANLRRENIDVFYVPFGFTSIRLPGVPRITTVVDLLHIDYPWSLPPQTREWRKLQFSKLLPVTDLFQVLSEFTAKRLQAAYQVPPDRILITNYAVQNRLQPEANSHKSRKPFFFYPANFWPHKNHEVLLLAYQLYLARSSANAAWDLVLSGHLDERGRFLQRTARDLGIADRISFLGFVPEDKLRMLYSAASCLVFPSLHEGFGIPILEAMSFGLPIICGRDTSVPEVAGEAALYTDPRNPDRLASDLSRISEDETLRHLLVQRGAEQLKKFDFKADVNRLAAAFFAVSRTKPRAHQILQKKILSELAIYYGHTFARKTLNKLVQVYQRKAAE